ncbi:MAG: hypothetical protein HYU66_28625 [Armatimonadetes bacterium]|nr:hypothetical protein [Armatimonadota bacterium]
MARKQESSRPPANRAAMLPLLLTVKLSQDPLNDGRISPFQCGQFIEYLCDLVPAMWAERLGDGSFEGLSPYGFAHLRETDFREHPWHPWGATHRALYEQDPDQRVGGAVSMRIRVDGGPPCTVGLAQEGVFVERGKPLDFHVWMRQEGIAGDVTVRLRHEGRTVAATVFRPGGEWQRYEARLVPAATQAEAALSIEFRGPGTLWLDSASLMPEDNLGGWRPDVVAALRALRPGMIRFGGSTVDGGRADFEWRSTLGDPDRRPPFRAWGGLQPAGAGLEEIVQLIQRVGAEPLICVRVTGREPRDAAEQVEYFNGAADTPMGRLRAANGHPAPYGICYWQIGNEVSGEAYEQRLAAFCQAMKAADPTIRLLSSYPGEGVLAQAGDQLDYLCPHHYGCADLAGMAADFERLRELIHRHGGGRDIRLGVTEWNTTAGDEGPRRAMLWTLANALACARYRNLLHRNADLVELSMRSNLANSFCSGILQTDSHRLYLTPTGYEDQLYATLSGAVPLRLELEPGDGAGLDLSATRSADGRQVTLFVVSDGLEPVPARLDTSALGRLRRKVGVWTLADRDRAGEPDVTNGFGDPKRVAPVTSAVELQGARLDYPFPALSLTVLRFTVE